MNNFGFLFFDYGKGKKNLTLIPIGGIVSFRLVFEKDQ
jgi:hypothetical protein